MTVGFAILLAVVAMQGVALGALLVQRSRRARAELRLREAEVSSRVLVDQVPVILWSARPDTTLDFVNQRTMEFTGQPLDKLMDRGWLDFVHPDDLERCVGTYVPAFEKREPFTFEYRIRRPDGAYLWLLATGVPKFAPDGTFAGYVGCDLDITKRKQAELEVHASRAALGASHREIQQLAGRLLEAQDAERARIARELHDDLSQQLAGISIGLSGLKRRLEATAVEEGLLGEVKTLHERTAHLAQSVRHLSHDLHPTVLRHAGLVAALTSYCAEIERSHGTRSACMADGDFAGLDPETALCLYRIAQEAMRNVIAHSRAGRAEVRLRLAGNEIELTVSDDGRGFDVTTSLHRSPGLGLVSISERARLAGGSLRIDSKPANGTRLQVRLPARSTAATEAAAASEAPREERA